MILSANQPAYLPWRPYFDRIENSDLHIVLDHVQFEKGSFTNRTRIQLPDGRLTWLTVPVEKRKTIAETRIVGDKWRKKHMETLIQTFSSPERGWRHHKYGLIPILADYPLLGDFLHVSLTCLLRELHINTRIMCSSDLQISGKGSQWLLNACKTLSANTYLSGPLGRDYLEVKEFEREGIEVRFHDYEPPDPPVSVLHELFR